MRKPGLYLVLLLLVGLVAGMTGVQAGPTCEPEPGPHVLTNTSTCFPTPQECATGNFNGVYDGGVEGRGSICAGGEGHIAVYTGGNANALCGIIIVADQVVTGDPDVDPNTCPE